MVRVSFATIASALLATAAAQGVKIKYMPFGDSITEIVCWRALLWKQLQDAGYKHVDFVGSQSKATNGAGCSKNPDYDKNHEGHGGYTATDIASRKQLVDWLKASPADIITMHLGTNDLTRGKRTNDIIAAYSTMVQQMRDANPKMRIIVSPLTASSTTPKTSKYFLCRWPRSLLQAITKVQPRI
jgi:lysophospholipase L1-like esterase